MGAGKSRTIGWMSEQGYFPLSQIVHLDPDMFKTHFPEWQGYLSTAMCEAGSRTRRESGYLVEIAQQAAMALARNPVVASRRLAPRRRLWGRGNEHTIGRLRHAASSTAASRWPASSATSLNCVEIN